MKKLNFSAIATQSLAKEEEAVKNRFDAADEILTKRSPAPPAAKPAEEASRPKSDKPKTVPKTKPEKMPKEKVIRDTFSLPFSDYQLIGKIVQRTAKIGMPVNKSEAIRLGLKAVEAMKEAELEALLQKLVKLRQRKYAMPE
jgi:hypothetical protein